MKDFSYCFWRRRSRWSCASSCLNGGKQKEGCTLTLDWYSSYWNKPEVLHQLYWKMGEVLGKFTWEETIWAIKAGSLLLQSSVFFY